MLRASSLTTVAIFCSASGRAPSRWHSSRTAMRARATSRSARTSSSSATSGAPASMWTAGSSSVKVEPWPGRLLTRISPPSM